MNEVSLKLLKPHTKNNDYYSDLPEEKYAEVKRSIEINGIRDPLKVLPDYTIIAGHQRFRIAQELGLEKVPVIILDVTAEEAEYLLIADNEERRQEDNDPIKKAKRAKFLKEYWRIQHGGNHGNQYKVAINPMGELPKTSADVAKAVGTDSAHLPRLLKLNDLIPELQKLVSASKLGARAAEQLAYLEPSVQKALWDTLGEEIGQKSVVETKQLRKELEESRQKQKEIQTSFEDQITLLKENIEDAEKAITDSEEQISELEEKLAKANKPKEVPPADYEEIKSQLAEKKNELEQEQSKSKELQETLKQTLLELEQKKDDFRSLTKSQIESSNRQKIRSTLSYLAQDLGKHLKQCQIDIERFAPNEEIYDDVMAAARILRHSANELELMVKTHSCEIIPLPVKEGGDHSGKNIS